jgi:phosphoglycolate phosphatase-like HAD superfamily hydrolase/CTP:molybdopterin cytidylyltransferase MocA
VSVAGLLLAAGGGARFGAPKALVRLHGERLVDRGARVLRDGGCDAVVVVSGAVALEGAVPNPAWGSGLGSSLQRGLDAAGDAAAVVVTLVDQPLVGAEAVRRVVAAWRSGAQAVVATYDGQPGHPVLLDRSLWAGVREHAVGDVGARGFLRARPDLVTEVACDGTGRPDDVDTPADLARIRAQLAEVILFDLDGVLVDSRGPITASINAALTRHGFRALPEPELYRCIGPPLPDGFAELVAEQQGDQGLVPDLCASYREVYATAVERTRAFPGIPELLADLGADRPLALVTSKGEPFARRIVEIVGLDRCFATLAAPSFEAQPEPKATTVARALDALGLAGDRAALVGDRHHDVEAAHAHDVLAIGVTWGIGTPEELTDAGADLLVSSPAALGEALGT